MEGHAAAYPFSIQNSNLVNTLPSEAVISDLMLPGTKQWNLRLIKDIFLEEEANLIAHIPISQLRRADKLVWNLTSNGLFTINSSYHSTSSLIRSKEGESSKRHQLEPLWKVL